MASHTCTTCYVSAAGNDANDGTAKTQGAGTVGPWKHAPGMVGAASNANSQVPATGDSYIFRGGDTWHFGNPTPSSGVATNGTWDWFWSGSSSNCVYQGATTGCIYIGVDPTYFAGGSWARPILTGDNPPSLTQLGTACPFQIPQNTNLIPTPPNAMFASSAISHIILDNFEMTGLCTNQNDTNDQGYFNTFIVDFGNGGSGLENFYEHNYFHGWTRGSAWTLAGTGGVPNMHIYGMGLAGTGDFIGNVIDGSDSGVGFMVWGEFPSFYRFVDNMTRYVAQGVGQNCHDIHDNVWEHMEDGNGYSIPHNNVFECNHDFGDTSVGVPAALPTTANVWYNNVYRHDDSSMIGKGAVPLWICPNTLPEYYFGNVFYDTFQAVNLAYLSGGNNTGCVGTGGQYMFNNTLVDEFYQNCGNNATPIGGQYLHVFNEHLINTPWEAPSGTPCIGYLNASDLSMTKTASNTQGYTSAGVSGTVTTQTCANESTPCAPTSALNASVATGANHQDYCTALAAFAAAEPAIGVTAANACKFGTTDACTYDAVNHKMNCPAQTAVVRPVSAAWDIGAYQFTTSGGTPPTITRSSLAGGTVGAAYSQTVSATGDATITWTRTVGTLPAGLSGCSGTTGPSCTISGTPTTAATSNFTLQAANGVLPNAQQAFSITINPAPLPAVTLGCTTHNFGTQVVGTPSAGFPCTLTNTGSAQLTIASITPSGDFSDSSNCPLSPAHLAIGSFCTITSTFTPTLPGPRSGSISISDDAPTSPQTITLSGTGLAVPTGSIMTGTINGGKIQ